MAWGVLLAGPVLADGQIVLSGTGVLENQSIGTVVGTFSPAQSETGHTYAFSLVGGDTEVFRLDGDDLKTTEVLDRETATSYRLWVKMTDSGGSPIYEWHTISVLNENEAPVILEGTGDSVTMSEDGSPTAFGLTLHVEDEDPGDTTTWTLASAPAHGTASVSGVGDSKAIGYTPHTNYHGTDSFEVRVTDGGGLSDVIRVDVTITPVNDAPSARADSVTTGEEQVLVISPLNNDTDLDGDSVTLDVVQAPASGNAVKSGSQVVYTPTLDFVGRDTIVYGITDGNLQNYATIYVYVTDVNDAPAITEGASTSVTMSEDGNPTPFALTLNATDVDGTTLNWAVLSVPSHGTASVADTGPLTATIGYAPDANYHGSDSFQILTSDGQASDSITVNVTVSSVNDPPVGQDDAVTTDEEVAVVVDVLANDSDPVEGTAVTLVSAGSPLHGTAAVSGTTQILYTPDADFNGTEGFVYTLSDAGGETASATMVITVRDVNDAPVIGIVETVTWDPVGSPGFSPKVTASRLGGLVR